jgi:hypothetical protein
MPASKGIDASVELTAHAVSLKSQGIDFVLRYYSNNARKNLSLGEARALSEAGLQIGVVWESGGVKSEFFNHVQGVADGSAAYLMACKSIGQPLGSAIYFAVDYDASAADIADCIGPYFAGVRAGFDAASKGAAGYQIGVYGSGLCCQTLLSSGLADMSWLSQSTGFSGSKDYASEQRYNLIQYAGAKISVDGGATLSVDLDATSASLAAGLFKLA